MFQPEMCKKTAFYCDYIDNQLWVVVVVVVVVLV